MKRFAATALALYLAGCASREMPPGMSTQLLPGQAMLIQASGRAPTAHITNQGPGLLVVTQQDNSLEFRLGAPGSADVPIKESLRVTNGSAERTSLSVTVSGAEATEIKAPVSGSK